MDKYNTRLSNLNPTNYINNHVLTLEYNYRKAFFDLNIITNEPWLLVLQYETDYAVSGKVIDYVEKCFRDQIRRR